MRAQRQSHSIERAGFTDEEEEQTDEATSPVKSAACKKSTKKTPAFQKQGRTRLTSHLLKYHPDRAVKRRKDAMMLRAVVAEMISESIPCSELCPPPPSGKEVSRGWVGSI